MCSKHCGIKLKISLALLVLLLLPLSAYSEQCLSDEEAAVISQIIADSKTALTISNQELTIVSIERDESNQEIARLSELLNLSGIEITALKTDLTTSKSQIIQLSTDLAELKKSCRAQNINSLLIGTGIGAVIVGGIWAYCELKG